MARLQEIQKLDRSQRVEKEPAEVIELAPPIDMDDWVPEMGWEMEDYE